MSSTLDDIANEYRNKYPLLQCAAKSVEDTLKELLQATPHIDFISARAKSVNKFIDKIARKRYEHPLQDIQDQIGARVIVFYKSDVKNVEERVLSEFRIYEKIAKEPEQPNQFGYEAEHIVCFLPPDIIETHSLKIDFFELQICTMFQHAWAEANHDLGYKPEGEVSNDITRKLAWAAAQAYGADTIFNDIWKSLNSNHNEDLQKN